MALTKISRSLLDTGISDSSDATAITINSSENVGIGTTSVTSSIGWTPKLVLDATSAALILKGVNSQENAIGVSNGMYLDSMGSTTGSYNSFYFRNTSTNSSFSASERMRINSSGVLCIGTTGDGSASSINCLSTPTNANVGVARFQATGEAAGTTAMCVVKSVNDNSTSNVFVRFGINGYAGGSGQINANGSSQAAFGSFSDRRLKENITDLPSQLDKIKAMRPVEFDYIESEGGGHQLGFVAQEIEEIYPDMVGEREDGMKTLSGLGKWEARLVKAIQEQQEQIEALQSEINTLKGE